MASNYVVDACSSDVPVRASVLSGVPIDAILLFHVWLMVVRLKQKALPVVGSHRRLSEIIQNLVFAGKSAGDFYGSLANSLLLDQFRAEIFSRCENSARV